MEANEKEFEQLRQLSYALAMNMMKNHDDAEDVAQNTLFQFISANDVQNAEAWTKKVTHHLVVEKFRDQKKTMNISHKLNVNESEDEEATRKKRELLDFNHLSQEKIKKYLTVSERKLYKEFFNCDFSIKKYSEKYKVSYNIAQKRIDMIRRNLKAAYLKEKGFCVTATLTYAQWNTIYTLIRRKYLNNMDIPYPFDTFHAFAYCKKKDYELVLVFGEFKKELVLFVLKGKFLKNKFKVNEIKLPASVRVISNEEKAKIFEDPRTIVNK